MLVFIPYSFLASILKIPNGHKNRGTRKSPLTLHVLTPVNRKKQSTNHHSLVIGQIAHNNYTKLAGCAVQKEENSIL